MKEKSFITLTPGVSLAPEQEGVLGRLLLAAVALLFVNVDLDLLNLEDKLKHFLSSTK